MSGMSDVFHLHCVLAMCMIKSNLNYHKHIPMHLPFLYNVSFWNLVEVWWNSWGQNQWVTKSRCFHYQTSGKLLDFYRTGGPVTTWENTSFTGPPTLLQDLIFFQNKSPHRGAPNKIFFTGQEDRHSIGFQQSSAVFTGRGPRTGEFPNVCTITDDVIGFCG